MRLFLVQWSFFFICFSQFLPIQGVESEESVATLEGLPSSIVNGSVCVITGDLTDSVLDLILPGPEPLVLSRNYSSRDCGGGYGVGWHSNHVDCMKYESGRWDGKSSWLCQLVQPSGACLNYTHEDHKDNKYKTKLDLMFRKPKGLSNISGSEISGRTNVKNQKIQFLPQKNNFDCINGAGNRRLFSYKYMANGIRIYSQDLETKVNGSSYRYHSLLEVPLGLNKMECFHTKSKTPYSQVELFIPGGRRFQDANACHLRTSDGRTIKYKYFSHHFTEHVKDGNDEITEFYLKEVEADHKPREKYEYEDRHGYAKGKNLCRKSLPHNRYLKAAYYQTGTNYVGSRFSDIHIKSDDFRINRVRRLEAPAGKTEEPVTINRFIYDIKSKTVGDRTEYLDGQTNVYDAYYHRTKYCFNKEHRLTSIAKYSGTENYSLYSTEKYVWGKEHSHQEGNLAGKYLEDADGAIHHYRLYKYDDHGNIVENRLYGKLTGRKEANIELDDHGIPRHGCCEYELKQCVYTNEGLNLLQEEIDTNGKKTIYHYQPGTDLITARYVSFQDLIKTREFLEYNDLNVLCAKIIDDGTCLEKDDLSGATQRLITRYETRKSMPGVGLVEQEENFYLDLTAGEEIFLGSILYGYTKEGLVEKEEHVDADGKMRFTKTWAYNAHGKIEMEKNGLDEVIIRKYDDNDNLVYEQGPHPDFYTVNSYDFMNRLIKQEEIHTDGKRFITSHEYDYLGNCTCTINPYGHATRFQYDSQGRVKKIQMPKVIDQLGQLVRPVIQKRYDVAGFPTSIIDPLGNETKIEYNIRGKPTRIIYPDRTEESFCYLLDGQLEKKFEKNGTYTVYQYDYQGRPTRELLVNSSKHVLKAKYWTYNAFHMTSYEDCMGLVTNYEYDGAGRLIKTVKFDKHDPEKSCRIQEFAYDSLGRLIKTKEWYGTGETDYRFICQDYDLLNRVTQEWVEAPDGQIMAYNQYGYDCNGNKCFVQDGDNMTLTEHDAHGNPTKITNGMGHVTHAIFDTSFVNEHGQNVLQTLTTDPLGYQTIDTYDSANRLVGTIKKNPYGIQVAGQKICYDLCGNRIQLVDQVFSDGKLLDSHRTLFSYTADHQIECITEAEGTPLQKSTRYRYQLGKKSVLIKPDGTKLHYEYDQVNRLKTVKAADGSVAYAYHYDRNDQVKEIRDEIHQMDAERCYNPFGDLEWERLSSGLTVGYDYDHVGQLKRLILPDESQIAYEYNAANLVNVHRIKEGEKKYTHAYFNHNLSGEATKVVPVGCNGTIDYCFDALGRYLSIDHPHCSQKVGAEGYNKVGNLLSYQSQGIEYEFCYDDLYQLKSEKGHQSHSYQNDSLSNRLRKDDEEYQVNVLNQLIRKGKETYQYDQNGNLVERQRGDEKTRYAYDALDRLVQVIHNDELIQYAYDGFNRRLKVVKGQGEERHFLFAGQEEIGSVVNGEIVELKVISKGERTPAIALEIKGTLYVPFYDIFGQIVCLNTAQGEVVERYRYTAYGETEIVDAAGVKLKGSTVGNPWIYANRRLDPETGFVAFGLRYYDPEAGRWITADPAGFEDGPNLYAYVHNNPLIYLDRYGLFALNSGRQNWLLDSPLGAPIAMMDYGTRDLTTAEVFHRNYDDSIPTFIPTRDNYHMHLEDRVWGTPGVYSANRDFGCNYREDSRINAIFVHGFNTDFNTFVKNLLHLSELNQWNVKGIYYGKHSMPKNLLHQYNALFRCIAYPPTRMLLSTMYKGFDEGSEGAECIMIGHSHGEVHIQNALIASSESRQRVHVIGIAPACSIDPRLCASVRNFCSLRDYVPLADFLNVFRHRNNIVLLKPWRGAAWHDHPLQSRTFARPMSREFEKIVNHIKGGK